MGLYMGAYIRGGGAYNHNGLSISEYGGLIHRSGGSYSGGYTQGFMGSDHFFVFSIIQASNFPEINRRQWR